MEEIFLKDIFKLIKKNFFFIIIIGVIGIFAAYVLNEFFLEKKYEAKIKMYALTEWGDNPTHEVNALLFSQRVVNSYIQILGSNAFYDRVIEDSQIEFTPAQLRSMTKYTILNSTEVFEARVVSKSPETSKRIADSIAKIAPEFIGFYHNKFAVSVIDFPILSDAPFYPNLKLNVVIGFMAGIFIAMVYVLIKNLMKYTIKDADELTEKYAIPVLAVIPFVNIKLD